ncbi:MAG: thioredoxin domain-containing protein [bacterium]|nr:thioredoxin domain-containing protein [bacterium]
MRRRLLFIGGGLFILLLLAWLSFGLVEKGGSEETASLLLSAASADDWKLGGENAKAVLVEYSDFQCPACASYEPLLQALHEELGDSMLFVYRHFPLRQIHANAENAARAAEAAGKQGKFWEMHSVLFERQKEWSDDRDAEGTFVSYAGALGLDTARFVNDFHSQGVKENVQRDYESGVRAGISGTPTFYLNGRKIQNPRSYDEFKNAINEALAAANQ